MYITVHILYELLFWKPQKIDFACIFFFQSSCSVYCLLMLMSCCLPHTPTTLTHSFTQHVVVFSDCCALSRVSVRVFQRHLLNLNHCCWMTTNFSRFALSRTNSDSALHQSVMNPNAQESFNSPGNQMHFPSQRGKLKQILPIILHNITAQVVGRPFSQFLYVFKSFFGTSSNTPLIGMLILA